MDLMPFVNKAGCECLNESDDCGFDNCLLKDSSYLESDCDEQVRDKTDSNQSRVWRCIFIVSKTKNQTSIFCLQLLITIAFNQPVKLFSMKLQSSDFGESFLH